MPIARRGEVWQVDHERAVYTIVPHTLAVRGTRFEVKLEVPGIEPGAFDVQGLRNIPGTVLMRKRGVLTAEQMAQIEHAVKLWLGLT